MTKSILACDGVRDVSMIRAFLKDEGGGPLAEFTLVIFLLMSMSMAIVDFSRAVWQWNAAQKATQVAARIAVVRDPLYLPIKYHFNCNPPATILLGELCLDSATNTMRADCDFGTVVCTKDGCDGNAYAADQAQQFAEIYDAMRLAYTYLEDDEISITYTPTTLGFIGKPGGPIAEVTAEISGDNFRFLLLLPWGFNFMEMQALRTTLTSEDFSDNSLIEQGLVKNPPPVVPVCL